MNRRCKVYLHFFFEVVLAVCKKSETTNGEIEGKVCGLYVIF